MACSDFLVAVVVAVGLSISAKWTALCPAHDSERPSPSWKTLGSNCRLWGPT